MAFGSPLNLARSELSAVTPAGVSAAAEAALDGGATHYTDTSGLPELRHAVANMLADVSGLDFAADGEVLITSGVQEALFVGLQVLVGQKSDVVVVGPSPPADIELVHAVGGRARVAACDADLQLDPHAVRDIVTAETRVVLIHLASASGQVVPRRTLEMLAETIKRHDAFAIAVETEDRSTDQVQQTSLAAIDGMRERTVTVGGFAWAGLSAWRVAYLAAPRDVMVPMKRLKEEVSISAPAVSQYAALAACGSRREEERARRERLDERRDAVVRALAGTPLRSVIPEVGPFVFIQPPGGVDLQRLLLATSRVGISVADGRVCGADGWLRLTLDYEPALLTRAASELVEILLSPKQESD